MNNKINMFLNNIMEAEPMVQDKEDKYDFSAKPGETFDDVERRQVEAALQEEIREAEGIISHFVGIGSAYGIDITVDEIGDPIPPPLVESEDES